MKKYILIILLHRIYINGTGEKINNIGTCIR